MATKKPVQNQKKSNGKEEKKPEKKKAKFVNSAIAWGLLALEAVIIAIICIIVFG